MFASAYSSLPMLAASPLLSSLEVDQLLLDLKELLLNTIVPLVSSIAQVEFEYPSKTESCFFSLQR